MSYLTSKQSSFLLSAQSLIQHLQIKQCLEIRNYFISVFITVNYELTWKILSLSLSLSLSISCCSHLEHMASMKRFVSLQFLHLGQSLGLLEWGFGLPQDRYQHKRRINANIHAMNGIQTQDPSIRAGKESVENANKYNMLRRPALS
jgi:hypothetical protein